MLINRLFLCCGAFIIFQSNVFADQPPRPRWDVPDHNRTIPLPIGKDGNNITMEQINLYSDSPIISIPRPEFANFVSNLYCTAPITKKLIQSYESIGDNGNSQIVLRSIYSCGDNRIALTTVDLIKSYADRLTASEIQINELNKKINMLLSNVKTLSDINDALTKRLEEMEHTISLK